MKNGLEKSAIVLLAVLVNVGLYLMVPALQLAAARKAAKQPKPSTTMVRNIEFVEPTREKMRTRDIKPLKVEKYTSPSLANTRPTLPGGGLKIDLSAAGGAGPGLFSGGDIRGQIGKGAGGGVGDNMAPRTYEPGETDTDALAMGDPPLNYPPRAEREGVTGFADLTFVVNESGFVEQIQVLKEEPKGFGFAAAAMESAKKMRFKPATLEKTPVRQRFKRRFNFDQ